MMSDDDVVAFLKHYNHIPVTKNMNQQFIPVTVLDVSEAGMELFNYISSLLKKIKLPRIVRTPSGGISTKNIPLGYDIRAINSCVEITILFRVALRFQFRSDISKADKENAITGTTAFKIFNQTCKKYNVDISNYFVSDGELIKQTIPAPYAFVCRNKELKIWRKHANHIDLHSAYMGAIAKEIPELFAPINELYLGRKENPVNKGVLTHSFGYFQSKIINYKLANLSKIAIEKTIEKLKELTAKIEEAGGFILAYNTDGIWYYGNVYHGEGEGDKLFEWSSDYVNCDAYFESIGRYAFKGIDAKTNNFVEKVIARGKYALDKIKPRKEWTMRDLLENKLGERSSFLFDSEKELIYNIKG